MKILFEYESDQEQTAVLTAVAASAHVSVEEVEAHLKEYLQNYIAQQYKVGGLINAPGREKKFAKLAIKEAVETLFSK